MYKSLATDTGLTLKTKVWDEQGRVFNTSSSAFESFVLGSEANYKIAATEQGTGSGFYTSLVPAGIPVGTYTMTFYDDTNDEAEGSVTVVIPPSTPSVTPNPSLITELRILAHDYIDANRITREDPKAADGSDPDGSNVVFFLQHQNVVPGTVYVTQGTDIRNNTGFTLDDVNGILTFDTAPTEDIDPFVSDYNFYWYPDSYYSEFLINGALPLGYSDPSDVPDGLKHALLQYALAKYYITRSTEYAHKYASTGGGAGQSVEAVTKAFKDLADAAMKSGDTAREDFYKRQGRREAPASRIGTSRIDPMTPIR